MDLLEAMREIQALIDDGLVQVVGEGPDGSPLIDFTEKGRAEFGVRP